MPASRRPAYLLRRAEPLVRRALNQHRVVAVIGARQVGKTTLVRRVCEATGGMYVDLEEPGVLEAVELDPTALFQGKRPIVIDEFQQGGDALLRAVKRWVDQRKSPGQVLLTGSTRFTTVPMISESLAGRVVLLDLWPLSQGELRQASDGFVQAVFGAASRLKAFAAPALARMDVYRMLCAGGFPAVVRLSGPARQDWYESYIRTITQRDISTFSRVQDLDALQRLVSVLSARTAQLLNLTEIANELDVPRSTLGNYLPLLETVGLVYRLPAWSTNLVSRTVRHRKIYVTDVGLASNLLGVDPKALADPLGRALGPLLETFVAGELARQRTWSRVRTTLHHFRDHRGREVDLILEARDGRVVGVEVKASASVQLKDFRGLDYLAGRIGERFRRGVVLYLGDRAMSFGPGRIALPLSALWAL